MANKRIWLITVFMVIVIIVYSGWSYDSVSSEANVDDVIGIYNVVSLAIDLPSFFSSTNTLRKRDSLEPINNRLTYYAKTINRLSSDELINNEDIPSWFITLFFLHDELANISVPKALLDYPLLRKARGFIPKELRKDEKPVKESDYYKVFLTKDSINKGKVFINNNLSLLNKIEKRYEVLKEYLVAILFIETRLGKVTGDYSVVGVYNSLYHIDRKDFLKIFYHRLAKDHKFFAVVLADFLDNTSYTVDDRAKYFNVNSDIHSYKDFDIYALFNELDDYIYRRQKWAYKQLRSLIIISYKDYMDVHSLRGSWAGAFGMSQFLPSSYLAWAADSNEDGKIDLYNLEDALASTANYLKGHNFNVKSSKLISQAIYKYNHSNVYVDTVVSYARKLKSVR